MSYSRENMARAMDSARGAGQKPPPKVATPQVVGEAPSSAPREPRVYFTIEKKVGDATLQVGGGPGEEKAALDAINDAKKRFK
jgi:hypothetical protein